MTNLDELRRQLGRLQTDVKTGHVSHLDLGSLADQVDAVAREKSPEEFNRVLGRTPAAAGSLLVRAMEIKSAAQAAEDAKEITKEVYGDQRQLAKEAFPKGDAYRRPLPR